MGNSYCEFIASGQANEFHRNYHDLEYGFPIDSDSELLERLTMEIFQAGLSWDLVLKRRVFLRSAFENYEISRLIDWNPGNVENFMLQPGVIKNRMKVEATIYNARRLDRFRREGTSFASWLRSMPEQELAAWVKVMKKEFKFVGNEVVREFITSIGLFDVAHDPSCPVSPQYRQAILGIRGIGGGANS